MLSTVLFEIAQSVLPETLPEYFEKCFEKCCEECCKKRRKKCCKKRFQACCFCFRAAFFCRLFWRPFFGCFPELLRAISVHKFGRNVSKDIFGLKSTDTIAVCIEYFAIFCTWAK